VLRLLKLTEFVRCELEAAILTGSRASSRVFLAFYLYFYTLKRVIGPCGFQ
jgi:hypothetical protein